MKFLKKYSFGDVITIVFVLLIGMVVGAVIVLRKQDFFLDNEQYISSKFEKIKTLLSKEYVTPEKLEENQEEMAEGSIAWYVAWLGDPFTTYLTKKKNTMLFNNLKEQSGVEGIGVYLEKEENSEVVTVSEVIKYGPAYDAGMKKGDQILAIEGTDIQGKALEDVIEMIRGEKGSTVTLQISRKTMTGESDFFITIPRKEINIPSVASELQEFEGKKIGIFSISSISEHTSQLFVKESLELMQQGMQGLVLDLRGNGGGYLEEATRFLGHFLPKGSLTVKTKYFAFKDKNFYSDGVGELKDFPMVVLIDQLTASASEIIAQALREQGVTIVGMKSYGKGSIQSVQEFADGSSLKYTVGERFSAKDFSINGTGIVPDVEIPFDAENYEKNLFDNQLDLAKKTLATLLEKN